MEERKFRVWLPNHKIMEYGIELFYSHMIELENKKQIWVSEEENKEVMQFTGSLDLNEKEIYDNDIIENCDTKELQVVFWNQEKAAWYCRYLNDKDRIVSLCDSLANLNKKIGDVYSNPELLK